MTYSDFLKECCNLPTDEKQMISFVINSVGNLAKEKFNEKDIIDFCRGNIENLSTIAPGVMKYITVCDKIEELISRDVKNAPVSIVKNNLTKICEIIEEVAKQDEEENSRKNQSDLNTQTLIESYEKKFEEFQNKITNIEDDMKKKLEIADSKIENRTVSVLMNTVSILALFVAIAFAGFGTFSIFGEVSLDFAESYFKSITTLFVVALLTYNLILILLYFVCKIALNDGEKLEKVKLFGKEFFKSLFFWIDVILFVAIVVLFVLISARIIV